MQENWKILVPRNCFDGICSREALWKEVKSRYSCEAHGRDHSGPGISLQPMEMTNADIHTSAMKPHQSRWILPGGTASRGEAYGVSGSPNVHSVSLWRTHAWSRFILEGLQPLERTHSGAVLCWGRVEVWGEGAAESTGYRLTATPYSLSSLCPLRMGEGGKSVENGGLNWSLERTRGCGRCFSFCLCF